MESKSDVVVIGGCGHVGLPLGLALAEAGKRVVAVDSNPEAVVKVNGGQMPFLDEGAPEALSKARKNGLFRCTGDRKDVTEADVVITVIGTPVDEYLNPRLDLVTALLEEYAAVLRPGQLLILRSTVYPGTTARVERELRRRGLTIDVAFCPERVTEGRAFHEIRELPQIISGCSASAVRRAEDLFGTLTSRTIHLEPIAAELAKLFTNSWRYALFALANQFFMIANDHGLDFYEIFQAVTEDYPRSRGFAKAGFAAGPCLFKDTVQLHAFHNNAFFMGQAAVMINEGLPSYIVQRLKRRYPVGEMRIGILGMTFKADSDDSRSSLSFKLRKILQAECREVLCSDPYLKTDGLVSVDEVAKRADLIVIGVPHSAYKGLDFGKTPVVDVWNSVSKRLRTI